MNNFKNSDFQQLKPLIVKNFDIAICIDWSNEHHRKIRHYVESLIMYSWLKLYGSIGSEGGFILFSFNERTNLESKINVFRVLLRNECPETFQEFKCESCTVFKLWI